MSEKKELVHGTYHFDSRAPEEREREEKIKARNYWRRLIAAHLCSDGQIYDLQEKIIEQATRLVDELERIEAEEAKGKE